MQNEVKLIKGLRQPSIFFYQLKEAEVLKGYRLRIFLLFILSSLVYGLVAHFGIGMNSLSKELVDLSPTAFETEKFYFFIGRVLLGLLYAGIILFIPSLLFWTLSEEAEYRKLVVVQGLTLIILLIEKLTFIPLALYLSLNWFSSPFSLGVLSQYITSNSWVIYFLGCISLFKIWTLFIQYKGLKRLLAKKNWVIWGTLLLYNLVFWCITAFLAYIDFSSLL
jgi:hypothetical protein